MPGGTRSEALSRLLLVARALASGRRIRIRYQDGGGAVSSRPVTPLGLAWRTDHWLLAAHCHLRRALRHFRVERIRQAGLARGPADLRLSPEGFDARFFSAEGYLRSGGQPPSLATVRLGPPLADLAAALLPAALVEHPGGRVVLCHLRASDLSALTRLVESLGPSASLASKDDWRPRPAGPGEDLA